ncbi:MAG: glycine betaine ABC transporter substrate-binding protein [Ornithinimicrobium sp.]
MPSSRILRSVAVLGVAAIALVGCSDEGEGEGQGSMPQGNSQRVTLGTKDFTESVITGELYAQALSADGYQVTLRKNVGPTEVIDEALQDGDIDGYPEYLGVAATVVAGEDVIGMGEDETASIATEFYESRGQTLSEQTPFEDVDAIAVTTSFAQDNALRSIADLRELDSFTLGARPEFEERQQGFAGMQNTYGLTNGVFTPIDIEATYNALFQGDVDAANVFSTDAQLETGDYRVLEDTERIFGYQHVALVIDEDKLSSLGGDEFMTVINDVNKELTQGVMIEMNGAVDLEERDPADVARQFLREKGLLN